MSRMEEMKAINAAVSKIKGVDAEGATLAQATLVSENGFNIDSLALNQITDILAANGLSRDTVIDFEQLNAIESAVEAYCDVRSPAG